MNTFKLRFEAIVSDTTNRQLLREETGPEAAELAQRLQDGFRRSTPQLLELKSEDFEASYFIEDIRSDQHYDEVRCTVILRPYLGPSPARRRWQDTYGRWCDSGYTDLTALRGLLEISGPDHRGPEGETLLMLAAGAGALDIVRVLLDAGARVDLEDLGGSRASDWARRKGHHNTMAILDDAASSSHRS
jgi:hypothetical protein